MHCCFRPAHMDKGLAYTRLPQRANSQLVKVSIWQVSHGSRWPLGPGSAAQLSCPGVSSEMACVPLGVTGTTGWNWEVGPGVCCFLGAVSVEDSSLITGQGKNWGPKNWPQTSDCGEIGTTSERGPRSSKPDGRRGHSPGHCKKRTQGWEGVMVKLRCSMDGHQWDVHK